MGWGGRREAGSGLLREGVRIQLGWWACRSLSESRWGGRGRAVRGGPLQLGQKLGAREVLQLPRGSPLNHPRGAGRGAQGQEIWRPPLQRAQVELGRGGLWHCGGCGATFWRGPAEASGPHRDKAASVQTQLIPALGQQIPSG